MDQLIFPMIPTGTEANPKQLIPHKIPKMDFLIPGLLAATIGTTIGALALPKSFRSAFWITGITTAVCGYREADKRQKQQAYFAAAQEASFDLFAIQLANTVESQN